MGQLPRGLSPYASVRHYFGAELRAWRERRGLSQAALGTLVLHSGAEIGKVEKAERWPSTDLASRCDAALDTGGVFTRLLPLVNQQRTATATAGRAGDQGPHADDQAPTLAVTTDEGTIGMGSGVCGYGPQLSTDSVFVVVKIEDKDVLVPLSRRMLMLAGGALAVGNHRLSAVPTVDEAPLPDRVDLADVTQLELATDTVAAFDLRHGGRLAAEQGAALLRWALRVMRLELPETIHHRMCAAAGYLADRTGWALFDCGRHDAAQSVFGRGLDLADQAHDADLRTQVLCDMASQLVFLRKPVEALRLVDAAETRTLVPQLVAAVHGVRAEAYAVLGDAQRVWDEVGRAEDASVREPHSPAPRWLAAFRDAAGMHATTGYAAYLLARSGHASAGKQALIRLSAATATLAPTRSRARVFGSARLAAMHLTHPDGDSGVGAATARQVVSQVPGVRSARLARELRALHLATARHDNSEIRQLGRDLDRVLDRLG